jgi:uncharacterized protein
MARAETEITTPQASIYLQQLCKHWSHKFAVEFTPEKGRIPFSETSTCFLDAKDGVLKLAVETDGDVERLEGVVIEHLKRFSHREDIGVPVWRAI